MLNPLPGKSPITFAAQAALKLPQHPPKILAGTVTELLTMKEQLRVQHALVVFSGAENGFVGQQERDLLWKAFYVPIFEQHFGAKQELLAWECEAHDGLHLVEDQISAFTEHIKTECECGLSGPRIRPCATLSFGHEAQ